MGTKRVLLMHISRVSGHCCASLAIEQALHKLDREVKTLALDTFSYTNPLWGKLINRLYLFVIQSAPRIWDLLYDNEKVMQRLKRVRSLVHRLNDKKIKQLLDDFRPDVIVCTQAFPCGMLADYKRRHNLNTPLIGVLTDYAPHRYWLDGWVDIYIVPAPEIKQRLMERGIEEKRLVVLGIPIDSKFVNPVNREEAFRCFGLDLNFPVILIMGGGQGLGPIKEIVQTLDKLTYQAQLVAVCGRNRNLYHWLNKNKTAFHQPISILGYTDQVDSLMAVSSFILTKPGGLTSSEALSKALPIIIIHPLPGQESRNTQFLLGARVALKADTFTQLQSLAEELLTNPARLGELRQRARAFARPDSALKIAQLILNLIGQHKNN